MVHLSVGQTQRDLSHRFNIHQSTVSQIITTWANFLYTALGSVRIMMSEDEVKMTLPDDFQDLDTQMVMDCTGLKGLGAVRQADINNSERETKSFVYENMKLLDYNNSPVIILFSDKFDINNSCCFT